MVYVHKNATAPVSVTKEGRAGAVVFQDLLRSSFCKSLTKVWHSLTHLVHGRGVFLAGVLKAAQFSFRNAIVAASKESICS